MRWLIPFGLMVVALAGCSSAEAPRSRTQQGGAQSEAAGEQVAAKKQKAVKRGDMNDAFAEAKPEQLQANIGRKEAPAAPPVQRKIIYTARLDLSVEKYEYAKKAVKGLAKGKNGYIEKEDETGASGGPLSGTFTIRVPAGQFEDFMDEVAELGEVRRRSTDAKDIGEQYYDTATRVKNDKGREQSLNELYKQTLAEKAPASERMQVRRELDEIRKEIEVQEARLLRWDRDVSYSTVTVTLTQRKEYETPGGPSFGTTVSRTWDGSVEALTMFGKAIVLIAVALTPWLLALVVGTSPMCALLLLWALVRRWRGAKPAATVTPA
jgi:hypothetical protein